MELLLWGVCAAVGFGAWQLLARLWDHAVERISPDQQRWWYSTAKNLPFIVFNVVVVAVFLAALGATVIHFVAFPYFAVGLKNATSWGPGTMGGMLALWVYGFWCSPELPTISAPRERSLKPPAKLAKRQSAPPKKQSLAPPRRGRVIRTFREDLQ